MAESNGKQVRIFMDGAFDMMHFGHMNAFRLAKSLGTHLVVALNSAESITKCKGPPLMNDEERLAMVKSCKFVDEVVMDCPYIMNEEYLNWVVKEYNIDYVVHGDDPCIVDGKDVYAVPKATGKFRSIPRTEGVSTTDIVGRILSHIHARTDTETSDSPLGLRSDFFLTANLFRQFSANVIPPKNEDVIVYVDGDWDLLNPQHVHMLKAARECGTYLIVGIHGDLTINKRFGKRLPLLNLNERVLGVLGCRHVDDVLVDAPLEISKEMISRLRIHNVVRFIDSSEMTPTVETNRFKDAEEAMIVVSLPLPHVFSIEHAVKAIEAKRDHYTAKFEHKMRAEREFYANKHGGSD